MLRGLDGFSLHPVTCQRCGSQGPAGRGPVSPPFGGHSEGVTPLPIPNREVKPLSADGTWPARAWESRSPPILCIGPVFGGPEFFAARGRALAARRLAIVATLA